MTLTMPYLGHGKTKKNRFGSGGPCSSGGGSDAKPSGIAHRASCPAPCPGQHDSGTNGQNAGCRTAHGSTFAALLSPTERASPATWPVLGWTAPGTAEPGGGAGVFGGVETQRIARHTYSAYNCVSGKVKVTAPACRYVCVV